jgi:hypothetical protein
VVHEVAQQRIALYCVLVVRLDSEPLDTVCDGERLQPSRWKIRSTGTNIARRLWDQREELRGEYEDVHGTDPALWPVQHPGVVLDAVLSTAHGACLGCQWFDVTMPDFCADMATSWSSSSDVKHPSGRSHPWPAARLA